MSSKVIFKQKTTSMLINFVMELLDSFRDGIDLNLRQIDYTVADNLGRCFAGLSLHLG